MSERWTLNAPIDVVWTPEDLARICNAVRAMQAELRKFTVHVDVELNGVSILPPPEFDVAGHRNLFGRADISAGAAADRARRSQAIDVEETCPICGSDDCAGASAHRGG